MEEELPMGTMIDGESYLGKVLIRPLSPTGDVKLYLWPVRCLKSKMGGPTFGVEVKGDEVIRFDPHGPRGHWHKGGYDKLGAGGSHTEFPDGLVDIAPQVTWSLEQIREQGKQLIGEAGYPDQAAAMDQEMVKTATEAVMAQMENAANLRLQAIEQGLIAD